MGNVSELVTQTAATVTALTALFAAVWWLIGPRVHSAVREIATGAAAAHQQLRPEVDGTTAAHAAQAARQTQELPALRRQLDDLVRRLDKLDELRVPERLQLVELAQENTDRRLAGVEQALIQAIAVDAVLRDRRLREAGT